jgi:RNA polymerase sigma-70 factor, ECF subfamily
MKILSVDDLPNEALVRVFERYKEAALPYGIIPYSYKTARYVWLEYLRQKRNDPVGPFPPGFIETEPDDEPSTEDEENSNCLVGQLYQALDRLPETDKEILYLRYIKNDSIEQITTELGVSQDAVYVRIHRALKKLKMRLKKNKAIRS